MENLQEEIENKIIDHITEEAGDRLVVFKPQNNSEGTDLVVAKKGLYESGEKKGKKKSIIAKIQIFGSFSKQQAKEVFISVNGQIKQSENSIFKKDIDTSKFGSKKDIYLIFVFFDVVKQDIEDFLCFMTLDNFMKIADKSGNKDILKFESFLKPEKKDKYSKFLINKKALSRDLFNIISKR
ncbi:MAG: hypothetical protein A2402_01200 [Candidatus Staskawiczbacteria bacterium RIFOXYC1_FULL_37_43]|nr:MAG: hypothetical protein A2813_03710 [Candidatus Staskawiczbacteria bacterium RIFCSPHIGHO2_01_FULL_37_17]OGZ72441.1 MAG: hypothetical protein A2891_01125 [Candidatus Staskawiczbacteria bacterium RIFCSPLOWO2_01_FULL_37_19]OGZ75931.1 MAG: hypothetical protein A2205_02300 [Candidatus Staskawiczbacteria bacterium RIFOXYA1_FULL_37_15]OGZ76904.1 MAG: hypothetical protein A2280_03790 [Candidatus Staskawiczbacteria bacterium RIFOXYA12_FULL_37_10]OGZ80820.1 MAG: hypothetical protein A2353_01105 [Can